MCQAYEAERNSIVAGEERVAIRGFAAARAGEPENPNPFAWSKYDSEAWNHGHGCFEARILPWGLEKVYREVVGISAASEAQRKFQETGELPDELEKIIDAYVPR